MSRKLVIVESPTKSRTIAGYLGDDFEVVSSVGHIRDLAHKSEVPAELKKSSIGKFSIDIDGGFAPYYVVNSDKKKIVADIKRRLKEADELYLATDEDREGEAIAWHLLDVLKPKIPVKRLAFHEITREGIERALANPRDVDMELVEAQEARRVLDRLFGFELSPVMWLKVQSGLSAGRVQSVALRLVVDRERERMAFQSAEYWDLRAVFTAQEGQDAGRSFEAKLSSVDGKRVATGKDFDDRGVLTNARVIHIDAAHAGSLAAGLATADFTVAGVDSRPYRRRPAAPFITSTLIQESNRKLRLSARQAMGVAQALYQKGYITYMRSDSPVLSGEAVRAARKQAIDLYGSEAVPAKVRIYATGDTNAQEAHEAIRPAGDTFRTPESLRTVLSGEEFRMYEMIWKRTLASQMNDAVGTTSTVRVGATTAAHHAVEFSASGTILTSPGFMALYEESREKARYEEDEQKVEKESRLPVLAEGQRVSADGVEPLTHATTPPPRFTQGSMIKELEDRKFGRPSTYASIVDTLIDRGYVTLVKQALVPSWVAFAMIRLLENHFAWLIDYDFTAEMEEDLDRIASGNLSRLDWLTEFYFGAGAGAGAGASVDGGSGDGAGGEAGRALGLKRQVEALGDIDARANSTFPVGNDIVLRVGKFGPYVERAVEGSDKPETASIPDDLAPDELTVAKAEELLSNKSEGPQTLGTHPESRYPITAVNGRYGPYVTEVLPDGATGKPRTGSLIPPMTLETVTLEDAIKLLSLPRVVGVDPATGEEITAQNGRYGPYLKKGGDSRTLDNAELMFTATLDQALELFAQPKRGRGRTAAPPLKELGVDPVSEKAVVVKSGRFGDYITDGTTNVTIPRTENLESLTPERAYELLADKRAKGPAKKPAAKRGAGARGGAARGGATKSAAKPAAKTATKRAPRKKA